MSMLSREPDHDEYASNEPIPIRGAADGIGDTDSDIDSDVEEHELRRGRWLGQFRVFYQPIVSLADGSLIGMEALLRWQHPRHGTLAAGSFVDVAERAGMIRPLDEEVLRSAAVFRRELNARPGVELRVAVNATAADLLRPGLVEAVQKTLVETRIDAGMLEIEVSSIDIATQMDPLSTVLSELHEVGVGLSLDDYSGLQEPGPVLARLSFDAVKVDLWRLTGRSGPPQGLVDLVEEAQERGLRVIAKRVETVEHLRWLRQLNVDAAQGYALGAPVQAADFQSLLVDAGLAYAEPPLDSGRSLAA